MEPLCPLIGDPCMKHGCEFYDKIPASGEYTCRLALTNGYLDDIARYLQVITFSSEQLRSISAESIKSQAQQKATPELLRLVGLAKD